MLIILIGGPLHALASTVYRPTDDRTIVERVPRALVDLRGRAPTGSHPVGTQSQGNAAQAIDTASKAIAIGRRHANPRLFGYAQAALAPWWSMDTPPVGIQLLRAFIHQARHRFSDALGDLEGVLARDPGNAQAWLSRAAILSVRGEYEDAVRSCMHLIGYNRLIMTTCAARALLLTRHAPRMFTELKRAVDETASLQADVQAWIPVTLAELAAQQGERRLAMESFKKALELTPGDTRRLAKLADFLLANGVTDAVVRLLSDHHEALPLRLRFAIARRHRDRRPLIADIEALKESFEVEKRRGSQLHLSRGRRGAPLPVRPA